MPTIDFTVATRLYSRFVLFDYSTKVEDECTFSESEHEAAV